MKVCYKMSSSDNIVWDVAVSTEGRGPRSIVRFQDGRWNYAQDCFFTEQQCRRYHKLPPPGWGAKREKLAEALEKLADRFRG